MLLVIDVGNTNMVIGVYGEKHLIQNWRLRTERRTTEDEFNILAKNLFSEGHINSRNIHKTIISCVSLIDFSKLSLNVLSTRIFSLAKLIMTFDCKLFLSFQEALVC